MPLTCLSDWVDAAPRKCYTRLGLCPWREPNSSTLQANLAAELALLNPYGRLVITLTVLTCLLIACGSDPPLPGGSTERVAERVEVQITVAESSPGRPSWHGEFVARSTDGILPNERLMLTLDTGQKGTARVSETRFDSRTPATTVVHFTGMGLLI